MKTPFIMILCAYNYMSLELSDYLVIRILFTFFVHRMCQKSVHVTPCSVKVFGYSLCLKICALSTLMLWCGSNGMLKNIHSKIA